MRPSQLQHVQLCSSRWPVTCTVKRADDYKERHAFTSYANWIVPGHIMLGRYPFVEPNRCKTREQGEQQLRAILSTGVSTFVSLQGEMPPQAKMPIGGKDGFYPYKSTTDLVAACTPRAHLVTNMTGTRASLCAHLVSRCSGDTIAGAVVLGPLAQQAARASACACAGLSDPPPSEVVEGLRNPYLDKFVPPRRRAASDAYTQYKPIRPSYAHYPITDLSIPAADDLHLTLEDLAARVQKGARFSCTAHPVACSIAVPSTPGTDTVFHVTACHSESGCSVRESA